MLFRTIVLENCVNISFRFLLYCRVIIGLRKVIKNRNLRLFTSFVTKKQNKFFKKRMKRLCVYLFPIQDFFTGFLWKLITSCLRREAQTNQTTGIYIFVKYRELSHVQYDNDSLKIARGGKSWSWIVIFNWRDDFGSMELVFGQFILNWFIKRIAPLVNRLLGLGQCCHMLRKVSAA